MTSDMFVYSEHPIYSSSIPQRWLVLVLLAVTMTLCPSELHAQQKPSKLDSLLNLPEVVVVQEMRREAIPGKKLAGKELEKMSAFSVADAVRYFSGVQIKDYGGVGGLKTINVRSMGTNHMGVFYDGIQLGNAQNGQIDLGKFSLDNIEEIALYNGQKSGMLQSAKDYGSAGTLYLKSRRPTFADKERYHLSAKVRTGSFMLLAPSVLWEHKLSEKISYNISSEFISSDGKYKFRYRRVFPDGPVAYDTTAVRQNGDITAIRLESSLFGKVNNGEWDVHGYFYGSHRGLPGPIVKNVFSHGQRLRDRSFFLQSSYRQQLTPWYSMLVLAKYANDYNRYIDDDWTSPLFVDNKYTQREAYISVANKFSPLSWLTINLATDIQYNSLSANLREFAYPVRYTSLTALALQGKWNNVTLQLSGLATLISEKTKTHNTAPLKKIITPAAVFSWRILTGEDQLTLNAFYKDAFRAPTFNDLYYTFIGNSNLKPEYTTQYNIGLDYTHTSHSAWIQAWRLKVEAYHNKVRDKIVAVPAANMFRWMMINLGRVRILGAETNAGLTLSPIPGLIAKAEVSYTYQSAQDVTNPEDYFYKHQIPYIPWHSGTALFSADYKGWGLNYSFLYTGTRYHAKANDEENKSLPWYTSDLGIRKEWQLNKQTLRAQIDVNNILNQYYDVVLNYPMPGRNYKLTLHYSF